MGHDAEEARDLRQIVRELREELEKTKERLETEKGQLINCLEHVRQTVHQSYHKEQALYGCVQGICRDILSTFNAVGHHG